MSSGRRKILMVMAPALLAGGCGKTILQVMGGGSTGIVGLNVAPAGEGFYDRCGIKISDLSDSSAILLDQRLVARINLQGKQSEVGYNITLEANVHATAGGGSSVMETIIKVKENKSDDGGRLTNDMAAVAAYNASSRVQTESMSTGLLLKLQKTDPMFKGIECGVTFTGKSTTETVEGVGSVEFSPGLPLAVNPKAAITTLDSEIGSSRTFTAKARVLASGKDWASVGTETDVTVTIKKISGNYKSVAGLPSDAPAITSDLAYEITATSPLGDVSKIGISKRQVFFLNTQTKSLAGVLVEMGKFDEKLKREYPPVFAVPVD